MMLTLGLALLVGIGLSTRANASVGSNCIPPVTSSVYISVYGIGDNPDTVSCIAGNTTVLNNVYAKYDVTLHVPTDFNGKTAVLLQGGKASLSPEEVSGGAVKFSGVEFSKGSQLKLALIPYRYATGIFYKKSDDIMFMGGFDDDQQFYVETASAFDIYFAGESSLYDHLSIGDGSMAIKGSADIIDGRAIVSNVPIGAGNRVYALVSKNDEIEKAYMIGQKPFSDYRIFKVIAKDADLDYYSNVDSFMYEWFSEESPEEGPGESLDDFVVEQPAGNVLFYYAMSNNYPFISVNDGVDERIITAYDNYSATVVTSDNVYTLALKKSLPEMDQSLSRQPVFAMKWGEGEGEFPVPSMTIYVSDSQGRVSFLGEMETEIATFPLFFYWQAGIPSPFRIIPAGSVAFSPDDDTKAELPVVQLLRPGSESSIFGLQDLVWVATRADKLKDEYNEPFDVSRLLEFLIPRSLGL
ncbi:hypothetical protein [Paenibacillus hemerocallicola]|uniref:hypothetical protein n=1 Tax=Paenibacillus hemerocallicola TaxID=1172614 RepID=UPI00159EBCC1|nr:hypothetical protein [Paenibacillus hemerocallicola]